MAVRHHIKVIVIDRDQSFCDTLGVLLEDNGYRPRTFADPEQAIQAANDESCQIALVDLKTAGVHGTDVVEKLKSIDARMSVIALAEMPDFEAVRSVMRQGAGDYLIKPLKNEVLIEAVDRACQRLGLIYTSESELNKLIGQRIRAERLRQNLTLRQLSDRTDLTTSQLSQVELGKNAASIWALARISNSLGLRVSVLLSGL